MTQKHNSDKNRRIQISKRFGDQAQEIIWAKEERRISEIENKLENFRRQNFEELREKVKREKEERKETHLKIEEFITMTDNKIEDFLAIGQMAEF